MKIDLDKSSFLNELNDLILSDLVEQGERLDQKHKRLSIWEYTLTQRRNLCRTEIEHCAIDDILDQIRLRLCEIETTDISFSD